MSRQLSADERLLWRRVTAAVRPASHRSADEQSAVTAPILPIRKVIFSPEPLPAPGARKATPAKAATAATFDAKWDRKLRGGQVEPDRVVDLHGLTRESAHRRAIDAVGAAVRDGERIVVLITGRAPAAGSSRVDTPLRGIIRASIADWLAASQWRGHIAAVRAAHPRHGGAGAIYVVLRRPKASNA